MGKDKSKRKKQTKLSLAPRDGSEQPDLDRLATNEQSQVASVRYGMAGLSSRVNTKKSRVHSSRSHAGRSTAQQGTLDMAFARAASRASEAAALGLPTPDASSQVQKRVPLSDTDSATSSSSSDDMVGPNRSKRKRTSFSTENATAFFRPSVSSPTNPIATPRSKAKHPSPVPKNSLFGSSPSVRRISRLSSEEDATGPTKSKTRRSRNSSGTDESPTGSRSTRRSTRLQRANNANESEDDSPPRMKRLVRGRGKKPSPETADDSDEDVRPPITKRGKGTATNIVEEGDASDASEEVVTSSRRKRQRSPTDEGDSTSDNNSKKRTEKADLDEDLEFLRDSSPPPGAGKKVSAREERMMHLERMKARRASKGAIEISDDDGVEEDDGVEDESDVELEVEDTQPYDHKDNLDDFVEDDDDNIENDMDASAEMPLEFTRHAHKSVKEHFKDVVEWMVHNKLNPAFSRDDPIYRIAFRKVNTEVEGYALSKFMSTVWRPDFARALQARPIFNEDVLVEAFGETNCVACGRTSHPARFVVTFSGKAYDPKTLENLKEEDNSDDSISDDSSNDGDNDSRSVDVEGRLIPSESHRFFVGRNCKQNSSQAHALTHWRWHLYSWVVDWLQQAGYLDAEQVVERENWSTRKRTKYANRVVDELASTEIRNLWRDFKIQLETAKSQKTNDRYVRY